MRIYLACPITVGDQKENYHNAMKASRDLLMLGCAVFNPATFMLQPWAYEIPHDQWMRTSKDWLMQAEALIRLPGESKGADQEVRWAEELGIPIHTMESFTAWLNDV